MKLSKSKLALAKVISENGGWPERALWAVQDNCIAFFLGGKPEYKSGYRCWYSNCLDGVFVGTIACDEKVTNWHQTVLSREEYYQAYPNVDADGWIEWKGGKCPVDKDARIDIRMTGGATHYDTDTDWGWNADSFKITHYRLHKPEVKPELCESVMRSITEPESIDGLCAKVTEENKHQHVDAKPTIEQLAQDYRNKLDFAKRKQDEADKANMESDAALSQLEDAIAAIGFVITPLAATEKEPELVITDWRDLRVGDEIEVFNFEYPEDESRRKQELMSGPCIVMQVEGGNVRIELKKNLPTKGPHWNATGIDACDFKFIRRP